LIPLILAFLASEKDNPEKFFCHAYKKDWSSELCFNHSAGNFTAMKIGLNTLDITLISMTNNTLGMVIIANEYESGGIP
jgi:hypothetical protein